MHAAFCLPSQLCLFIFHDYVLNFPHLSGPCWSKGVLLLGELSCVPTHKESLIEPIGPSHSNLLWCFWWHQKQTFKLSDHIPDKRAGMCTGILRPINEGRDEYWHGGRGQISCTRFITDSEGLALREGLIRKLSFMGCDDLSHNWTRIEHEHCHKQAKLNCNFIQTRLSWSISVNTDPSVPLKHWCWQKIT